MNNVTSILGRAGLLLGLALVSDLAAADQFPVFENYIKVSGQTTDLTGSSSAYARRLQMPDNGSGGIEELKLGKELSDDTTLTLEGKALQGKEDYLGAIKIVKNEVGTFDLGYKRYRTFYDGIGGFFPLNNRWMQLDNPELHTDRAKFWAEVRIERPNAPQFELRYTNELRSGRKDSTIWGDTDFTGVPSYYGVGAAALNPPYSTNRKLVPAYIQLSERQQNWIGLVKHTVGNTKLELEIVHNLSTSHDRRTVNRYPGELQLFPRQSSSTNPPQVYPPATISNAVSGYDQQDFDGHITSYTGKFETSISDKVEIIGGVLYSEGAADIGGDRQMYQSIPTAVGTVVAVGGFVGATGRPPYSYTTAVGQTNEKVLAANLGAKFKPTADFTAKVTLKHEKTDVDGFNNTVYTSNQINQTTGAVTPVVINAPNVADRTEKTWTPEVDLRYTGIKDMALYANYDYRHSPGTEYSSSTGAGTGGVLGAAVTAYDNVKLNHAHYKAGANWTVNKALTLRGEVYYKDHKNGFYGYNTSLGDSFVLGYEFVGTKLTAIVKAANNLSFTTRVVRQTGKMDVTIDGGTSMRSNDMTNWQVGETVDYSPSAQLYIQGNFNAAFNTIQTSFPVVGGLGNEVLRNSDNNYMSGSLVAGWVAGKDTDASVQFTFYRANNYKTPTYATQWYGAGAMEHIFTVGVKHRFSDKLIGQLKLGYVDSNNETTGGNTDFRGPICYLSFDHAL
ncbi:MAG TPA: hypothetical protein VG734_22430 [Lacunisphaera sp.]|nr:hypothetical protein [Lacunisphaera sp.]